VRQKLLKRSPKIIQVALSVKNLEKPDATANSESLLLGHFPRIIVIK